jgi:hypothetical protein
MWAFERRDFAEMSGSGRTKRLKNGSKKQRILMRF